MSAYSEQDIPFPHPTAMQVDHAWQEISIPIDSVTSLEIRTLLNHFQSHLASLLSPAPISCHNNRSGRCLDQALLCFSKLSVFSEADESLCAVLFSLLAMSASHMDAVYQGLGSLVNDSNVLKDCVEWGERRPWLTAARRYAHLAWSPLNRLLDQHIVSEEDLENILMSLLNVFTTDVSSLVDFSLTMLTQSGHFRRLQAHLRSSWSLFTLP